MACSQRRPTAPPAATTASPLLIVRAHGLLLRSGGPCLGGKCSLQALCSRPRNPRAEKALKTAQHLHPIPSATPAARIPQPGLFCAPFSHDPLARPKRFAPVRLPSRKTPSLGGESSSFRSTSGPQLVLDLLPALAPKTLFVSLRATSSRPFVLKDSLIQKEARA